MMIKNDSDGEYTDSELADSSSETQADETRPEGEYTDSETPDENRADTSHASS